MTGRLSFVALSLVPALRDDGAVLGDYPVQLHARYINFLSK